MKSVAEQMALIRRGVEQIEPEAELVKKLERSVATGKPLRIKYGIDPTGIDVHLGHTVPLRKLRLFQELGHQAVLIIGDYTALVGDPSGRDQTRARLTQEAVAKNAIDYLHQISKIIDIDKTERHYNGSWFGKMTFLDVLSLTSKITVQRMLERDDFTKRFRAEPSEPIYLHECLYPLMQGQDSVEIRADLELGGSEQLFNLMMGRRLQTDAGQEPQICLTLPILRGLDGVRRMGKSLGNYVGVGMSAKEQFGRVMSIPDTLLSEWFTLLTDRDTDEISRLTNAYPGPDRPETPPMEAKKLLGRDIVTFYHGPEIAAKVQEDWVNQFSRGKAPAEIDEVEVSAAGLSDGQLPAFKLLVAVKLADSNNKARQVIQQGGVTLGEEQVKVADPNQTIPVVSGLLVRAGRKWVRVRLV